MNIREEANKYFEELARPYVEKSSSKSKHEKFDIKHKHPYRVADLCVEIAEDLKMSKHDVDMAYVIGLLHDIGRFEQIDLYNSIDDAATIDHGDLGDEMIRELDFINEYYSAEDVDVIGNSIRSHNKLCISDEITNDREISFCKIVRDADKIDIFYVWTKILGEEGYQDMLTFRNGIRTISPNIKNTFENRKFIDRREIKTQADEILYGLCFVFDINYKKSFKILNKDDYIKEIFEIAKEYVAELADLEDDYRSFLKEKAS